VLLVLNSALLSAVVIHL